MHKKSALIFITALLVVSAFIFPDEGGSGQIDSNGDTLIVRGTGYPPIKARNLAQAHLMAKKAAVVDAYRNALAAAGIRNYDDDTLYTGLSGFVRGLVIIKEEYLEDGGISIHARISRRDIIVSSKTVKTVPDKSRETGTGPLKVTLEKWYRILKELVRFE